MVRCESTSASSFAPIFYRKMVLIACFNGGGQAVDIRNPSAPREAAFYMPATTEKTAKRCVTTDGGGPARSPAIQTHNVETDERGSVCLADRANTGVRIVKLAGEVRKIVGGN